MYKNLDRIQKVSLSFVQDLFEFFDYGRVNAGAFAVADGVGADLNLVGWSSSFAILW